MTVKSEFPLILGISGPPRAGKDLVAQIITEILDEGFFQASQAAGSMWPRSAHVSRVGVERMSWSLKEIATIFMPPEERGNLEQKKDTPINELGTTYRTVQIEVYKLGAKLFGKDWLGWRLLYLLHFRKNKQIILVPDFGRPEEVQVLIDYGLTVRQIQVRRPGTSFEGDSRVDFMISPLEHSYLIINNGTLEDLRSEVLKALRVLLPTDSGFSLPRA